ncbi:MAG: serine/threonine-protein kinase [Gemmatimonadota bacterium]
MTAPMPTSGDPLRDRLAAALAPAYTVEGELGRGGMSVVYRARDVRLRRDVAIKLLPPELAFVANVRERFMREAQTAAQLAHQNIVPIYGVEERDTLVWIVMALIEGETLGARLSREGKLAAPEAQRILGSVADALAYAHAHGVIHRDIKPDNILLERDTLRVMVTDFGIARAAEGDGRLTLTGVAVGTPTYMSPEQAMGESELDGRSDQYSLGVVGFHILAGAPPFSANSTPALLLKQVSEALPSLSLKAASAPPSLVKAIERALSKKPDERWASLKEFSQAVHATAAPSRAATGRSPAIGVPAVQLSALHTRDAGHRDAGRGAALANPPAPRPFGATPQAYSLPVPPRPPVPLAGANAVPAWVYGASGNAPSLALQADLFRDRARRNAVLLGICVVLNIATGEAPWFVIPAAVLGLNLSAKWRPLGDAGLRFMDVVRNRRAVQDAGLEGAVPATLFSNSLAGRARRFTRRVKTAAIAAGVSAVSLIIGAGTGVEELIAPFVAGGAFAFLSAVSAWRAYRPLGRLGFKLRDVFGGSWRDSDAARTPGTAFRLREEEVSQLAAPDVVMSAYGERLRLAVDDRTAIRQQLTRLGGEERAILPDVLPTVEGLVSRVSELAGALHQLDRDMGVVADGSLDARIADLRARRVSEDDRTLVLLLRQRQSLSELEGRRTALRSQLESASITLQNLRLDVLRLGSLGLEAPAMREVGRATEQARALSKDLAYLLEGAREADRI